jgi:glycosyltransferase involved in cell wall biosynthesis
MNKAADQINSPKNKIEKSAEMKIAAANGDKSNVLPRIALIVDVENWAYHNYAKQISKNLSHSYDFKIFFQADYQEIEQLFLEVKDYDLIHFFWRESLFSFLSPWVRHSIARKDWNYFDFITGIIADSNITTSVYDHLFLSEDEIKERAILYNALSIGYTTVSQRLCDIYSAIDKYPKPYGAVEDGVDLDFFVPVNPERFYREKDEIIVGWVGNSKWGGGDIDHKGLDSIIKPAVRSLREEGYKVRGFYADRHERWIPHSEMNNYYNSIDIYVCASDIEGTPNPALESMACGIPVISTDVGMIPQLFGEKQKEYILPERTIESLKIKLKELIESPEKRKELSEENLKEIKKWSWEKRCQKWDDFFNAMLLISQKDYIKQRRDFLRKQTLEMYLLSNAGKESESISEAQIETSAENINLSVQYNELKEFNRQLQHEIKMMEQSKFWKARKRWISLKQKFGFAKHEH